MTYPRSRGAYNLRAHAPAAAAAGNLRIVVLDERVARAAILGGLHSSQAVWRPAVLGNQIDQRAIEPKDAAACCSAEGSRAGGDSSKGRLYIEGRIGNDP
jgi:hypothetical protein